MLNSKTPLPKSSPGKAKAIGESSRGLKRQARISFGFTLIEVLLALALFATSLVMLTQAFVNTLLSLDSLESETAIQADLRFVRAEALQEADREKFEQGDEIETLSSARAYWQATVDSMPVSDLFKVLLTIELTPPEGESVRTFTQEILLLRPTWSDPVERSELIATNREKLNLDRLEKDRP